MPHQIRSILLIGPTGSGKTPLGEHLEQNGLMGTRCLHFDFGENLRKAASAAHPVYGLNAKEQACIKKVLADNALLENEQFPLAEKILRGFLAEKAYNAENLLVLNGLPRHSGQAEQFDRIAGMVLVIHLSCTAQAIRARIRGNTGGDRAGRNDDQAHMVEKKLELFEERTAPLVEHYRKKGVRVFVFGVEPHTAPADVLRVLERTLDRASLM